MESLSLRERIAMTIATRDPLEDWCGNPISWADISEGHRECYRRDADAILAIPGIAVVELPEPSEFADMWLHGNVHAASPSTHPGTPVALEIDPGSPVCFSSEYARDLAAALLAAADLAERDQ